MAGTTVGVHAPDLASHSLLTPKRPTLRLATDTTRTRRNHGVFLVGNELATVCSSRRGAGGFGVLLQVGRGALMLNGTMTPSQARTMARALTVAAQAAEAAPRGAGERQQDGGAE